MPDDYSANTETTGRVTVGGSATGEIQAGFDRDWFAVTLVAGRIYWIDLEGSQTGGGTLFNPYLRGVYDADGGRLPRTSNDNGGEGRNSRLTFTAGEDATYTAGEDVTYYVAASGLGYRLGTYTLSVTEVPDDFEADTGTSGVVEVDGSATGEIETGGDRDWFAVELDAGRTYLIDLEGSHTGAGTLRDPYLRGVYDADGNLLAGTTNDDGGAGLNSRVTFKAGEDATYYVAAGAYGDREGDYKLSVTELAYDDFAAGIETTGRVEVGGWTTGNVEPGGEIETGYDRDWFEVQLLAGTTYRIDLEGRKTADVTMTDPYLYGIHDANGDIIHGTVDDNGGRLNVNDRDNYNSRVTFTPTADGAYYVAAGGAGSDPGTYRLSVMVADDIADDFADGTETTGEVVVDGSVTGEIETRGDQDWFAVELDADTTYRIDLEGLVIVDDRFLESHLPPNVWMAFYGNPYTYGVNTYLRGVYDENGDLIPGTTNDNGGYGPDSRVTFTPPADGTYYVAAGAAGNDVGAYTLSVRFADDFAATTQTTGMVAVGGSARGVIETGYDRDWFAVELDAGKTYQIDLEGSPTGDGALRDPYLRGVHDANGGLITGTRNDDGGEGRNSRVTFTAEEDATYYVAAGAWYNGEGAYTLSVEEVM